MGPGPIRRLSRPHERASFRLPPSRAVAACPLLANEIKKQLHGFLFTLEDMRLRLAVHTDASPAAGQPGFSKQGLRNIHRIVARHVHRGVRAFDIKLIGLRGHAGRIVDHGAQVQREDSNRLMLLTDSFA